MCLNSWLRLQIVHIRSSSRSSIDAVLPAIVLAQLTIIYWLLSTTTTMTSTVATTTTSTSTTDEGLPAINFAASNSKCRTQLRELQFKSPNFAGSNLNCKRSKCALQTPQSPPRACKQKLKCFRKCENSPSDSNKFQNLNVLPSFPPL